MDSPLVTVIVPACNVELYLRECVESVIAQTYPRLEIIIADDGSSDATPIIAEEYARQDNRIKVIRLDGKGPSEARNSGMEIANGEWICFVDGDDEIHPRFVEFALAAMRGAGADIFSCSYLRKKPNPWIAPEATIHALKPKEAIEAILYQRPGMVCSVWAHLFKSETIKDLRFTPGIFYEDLDFFYRAYENASAIAHSDVPLYIYRLNPYGIMHTFSDKRLEVLNVTGRILCHYKGDEALEMAAADRCFAANCNMFVLCARNGHPAQKGCWDAIRRLRRKILLNDKSRLKNRLGALVSYLGKSCALAVASVFYRTS